MKPFAKGCNLSALMVRETVNVMVLTKDEALRDC